MTATRYHQLRRRIAAARSEAEAENGFVLIYVLVVTMLVTTAVTALVMTTTQAIKPTQDSVNRTLAYAAAQAGIQDAMAWMNANCPQNGTTCAAALGRAGSNVRTDGSNVLSGSSQSFGWKIAPSYIQDRASNPTYRYLRVTSVGSANGRAVSLVADLTGTPSVLDYEYYSTYETNGSADIKALNPGTSTAPRSIYIDCSSVSAAAGALSFPCASGSATAQWYGATGSIADGVTSALVPNPSVCDKLYYNSTGFNGAAGTGRANIQSGQPTLVTMPGTDWREAGLVGATPVTRYVPCQVAFTSGQSFDGPVYTADAPLISNGTPGGLPPTFAGGLYTAWQPSDSPQAPSAEYRSDPAPNIGGTLAAPAIARANPLTLANQFNPTPPATACIFYGPTRVKLNGDGTATVTSPQTTTALQTGSATCYANKNSAGQFTVNYGTNTTNRVIYVKNNGTGITATKQKSTSTPSASNTAFYLTNSAAGGSLDTNTVSAPDSCSSSATYTGATQSANCAWSGTFAAAASNWNSDVSSGSGWSQYSTGTTCGSDASNRLLFECEFNGGSVGTTHDIYSIFRQRVQNDLATNSISCGGQTFNPTTATAAQLTCYLQAKLSPADTTGAVSTSPTASGQHQYIVTASTSQPQTTTQTVRNSTAPNAPTGDSFFTQQAGSGATETVTTTSTTYTVSRQVSGCYGLFGLIGCFLASPTWGDGTTSGASTPQFQVTITQKSYSNLQAGSPAVSYFPSMQDVTQYGTGTGGANGTTGPGDVYLEGANTQPLSVLSDGDTVITGNLTASGSGATMIDALGDVRVYNPVKCADQTASDVNATTAGFCPNDLTGLYSGGLTSNGTLTSAHPANQYVNMLATPTSTITAGLLAQGTDNSMGSIRTDNANRGAGLGSLAITGGLYQRHRGALGVQWEYPSNGSGARAGSGYKVKLAYNDLQNAGLLYVPSFNGGSSSRYWNVVATSSCARVTGGLCS